MKARGIGRRGESWSWQLLMVVCAWSAPLALKVAAQDQFVLVDSTFTATAQNTMMSQYPLKPLPGVPQNWRSPVDYASGSIYVRFEILEKPSTRSTLCEVCFENSGTLTCMPYAAPYTAPGVITSAPVISKFWQYDVYDWTKPVELVQVVVKDSDTKLVQGDPQFYPTKMHVTVTVVPPGKTYVEDKPSDPKPNAGSSAMAAGAGAGRAGSSTAAAGSRSGGGGGGSRATPAAGSGAKAGTGTGAAGKAGSAAAAGRAGGAAGTSSVASPSTMASAGARAAGARAPEAADAGMMKPSVHDYLDPGSKCAVHDVRGGRGLGAGAWIAALLGVLRARRRRRSSPDVRIC